MKNKLDTKLAAIAHSCVSFPDRPFYFSSLLIVDFYAVQKSGLSLFNCEMSSSVLLDSRITNGADLIVWDSSHFLSWKHATSKLFQAGKDERFRSCIEILACSMYIQENDNFNNLTGQAVISLSLSLWCSQIFGTWFQIFLWLQIKKTLPCLLIFSLHNYWYRTL